MLKDRLVAHRAHIFAGLTLAGLLVVALLPARLVAPVTAQQGNVIMPDILVIPPGSAFRQTNFVSDLPGVGTIQDPLLVNPWGISDGAAPTSPFWVANQGPSFATLYFGDAGANAGRLIKIGLNVAIPGGLPTGTVFNSAVASAFVLPTGGKALFLFASLTGNITGWNGGTAAQTGASNPGHVYTGLAIGNNGLLNLLYAADTANKKIDVYNSTFALTTLAGTFTDTFPTPAIPADYAPFNIQSLGGKLYVTYAKIGSNGRSVSGAGLGFVSTFDFNGNFLGRLISNGQLNAPWGLAIAPASFGLFPGALLVGNFGEGGASINAFNPTSGASLGPLKNEANQDIVIDELWALRFGNGGGGDAGTLYFSAGIAAEEHGLFGSLKPTTASATSLIQFSASDYALGEGGGNIQITVTRSGDVSGPATINYATFDESQPGHASQKSDYEIALGKLSFAPGETSKTFKILIVDDKFVEGDETVNLVLSNPTGTGVGLGSPNQVNLTIADNDASPSATNPIDDAQFFVRQHYLDFLNREPDLAGFNFWVDQITSCGVDAACRDIRRTNVSAAFFLSIEFQNTGFLVYLTHKAAFGNVPVLYGTFERDTQALQKDFIVGQAGADAQLEANKQAFFNDFVTRPQFVDKYGSTLTDTAYVDTLLADAGIAPNDFSVNLTHAQENPPANPTTTGGARRPGSFGTARFQINAGETAMTFTSTVNNIDFTGTQTPGDTNDNMTAAHIHAGAAVTPTTNGGVVWGFFGAPFNDNTPNDVVNTPSVGGGGTISGKWDTPEGNNTTLTAQLPNIRAGRAYINFHTTQFGGGEIRGNFPATQVFRDSLVNGLNGATETRATVLRKVAESQFFASTEFNRAFVLMEYFGYLRRDADASGFNFWLNKLNEFGGNFVTSDMVKAFILSSEYRQRFGPG